MPATAERTTTSASRCTRTGNRVITALIQGALMVGALMAGALILGACGADDDGETESTQDLLEELEGRPLSPAEIAERTEVAELLCNLDDPVLVAVWAELTPSDFEFQDIVFTRTCPDRMALYAAETGRFVVDETEG